MGARSGPAPPIRAPPFWAGRSRRRGLLGACLAALLAPAAGARGCDLSNSEFAGFLLRTRAFYKHNVFEVVDAQQVNRILAAREALLPVCPAAVLQAILLKLEENIIYEARAHQELMVAYAGYLHTAVFQGSLLPGDLLEWPLSEGLERTADIGRELAAHRELSSAMVMNFCQPQDRFGTVHGLSWLLEPPFGEPGDSEDGEDVGLLSDTDLFIYLVDKPWCKELDPELVERLRRAVRSLHLVPYTGGPRREEQTAYFKFIVDLYDSLPDFTIFVHPDAPEHQGADFPALTRALKLIRTQSVFAHDAIGYYPLAHQMVVDPKRTWGERYASSWRRFWRQLYDSPWDSLGYRPPQCRWDVHKGKYIAGLVEGAEGRQSRAGAKATCVELDDCFGVTCGTRLDPIEQAEAGSVWSVSGLSLPEAAQWSASP